MLGSAFSSILHLIFLKPREYCALATHLTDGETGWQRWFRTSTRTAHLGEPGLSPALTSGPTPPGTPGNQSPLRPSLCSGSPLEESFCWTSAQVTEPQGSDNNSPSNWSLSPFSSLFLSLLWQRVLARSWDPRQPTHGCTRVPSSSLKASSAFSISFYLCVWSCRSLGQRR